MQTNQYFENYINNLQRNIFLIAYDSNYEIVSFINSYMKSKVRKELDKPYSSWQNQPSLRIVEEILTEYDIAKIKEQTINKDAVEWLGFFYSKWHFLTGESSKTIIHFLPAETALKNFFALHQLDEIEAIEICKRRYNLSRNNHRQNEYKNAAFSIKINNNPIYYSFLGKRLLYKLTKNPIFKNLEYIGGDDFDFLDVNDYFIAFKGDVLYKTNCINILDEFKKNNASINNYSKKCDKTIYFCFIFSSQYVTGNNDKLLRSHINDIRTLFPPGDRRFNYLYFYMLGKLYEVASNNEIYIYSMPLSLRENSGIENEMKKYYLM